MTHVAVLKWERVKQKPTVMNWATEKDIRRFILSNLNLKAVLIVELYSKPEEIPQNKSALLDVDAGQLAE